MALLLVVVFQVEAGVQLGQLVGQRRLKAMDMAVWQRGRSQLKGMWWQHFHLSPAWGMIWLNLATNVVAAARGG
jgi:hypothetical protein